MLSTAAYYFLLGLLALVPLLGVAVLLWRRFYREDVGNVARTVAKNADCR
ncbi:MAG TPA: hypothetical protein PKA05_03855 [Roseiflexaceae bacterium]|nr:hypothetical protein [Roseiflexaceae bacterium]